MSRAVKGIVDASAGKEGNNKGYNKEDKENFGDPK
jgi:hypothetical protein